MVRLNGGKEAILSVSVKNIGRTQVKNQFFFIAVEAISNNAFAVPDIKRIDGASFDPSNANTRTYSMFVGSDLEPNEEIKEDALIALGNTSAFKIWVICGSEKKEGGKEWASSRVYHVEM